MTTYAVGDEQRQRPGSEQPRRRGALVRVAPFVVTALVAGATGVAGTVMYQRIAAPDTAAVDAQAASLAKDLRQDLTAGFYSQGRAFGGQFTQGTLVTQTEAHGGVLLSADTVPGRLGGGSHTMTVMLGLVPPDAQTVAASAYPVRCYRYTFGIGAYTVKQSGTACPAERTDGKPGSLVAQMGALLAAQPTGAYRQMATAGYTHTSQGAVDFLTDKGFITARDTVTGVTGKAADGDAYVLALRINDTCHYLRMDASSAASRLIPLWPAPADEQETCGVKQAAAASILYGIDPAKAG
ncbi:hypothetical protein ABTY98_17185 [Streptomyces sp. NPDC096040]|uniref:hypothetical protein n=1 Tax=Streptomyces sp. NPDC096040 TaxID=3155541 RepID=UPI00332F0229